jgi:transcription antitermination factor NusG
MEQGRIGHRAEGIGQYERSEDPARCEAALRESSPGAILTTHNSQLTTDSWLVVKTKTKCEKFVRDKIMAMGIDAFVPLQKRTVKYNRKVKVYELPLISCYTFVKLDKSRRNLVLALPYVQGMLRMNGKDCLVSPEEIHWLQKISGTDLDVKTETLSMQQGDKVMLAYGHLAGMEGTIIAKRSKHEVAVALESLGLQMVLQVDPAMLVKT